MRNTNTPSFTKVAETRYDIRSLVETLVNPTRNLCITHKFEFQAEKIQIIPHAVQETWYKMRSDLPGLRSHGASIDPQVSRTTVLTRFINMMRSSGTPCSFKISTAFIAEPPVADLKCERAHSENYEGKHMPNIGSRRRT